MIESTSITEVQETKIKEATNETVERATALVIADDESFSAAGEFLIACKTLSKRIKATFDKPKKAAKAAHAAVCDAEKEHLVPVQEAESIVKKKIGAYTVEREAAARLEAKKEEERLRKQAEEDAIRRASEAEKSGDTKRAEREIATAVENKPVVNPTEAPKVSGVTTTTVFKFRIVDEDAVPRKYLSVDEKKIRRVVKALGKDAEIAGVEVYSDVQVGARV